jgi:hypothetical protein
VLRVKDNIKETLRFVADIRHRCGNRDQKETRRAMSVLDVAALLKNLGACCVLRACAIIAESFRIAVIHKLRIIVQVLAA